jgi:hypothetical protein
MLPFFGTGTDSDSDEDDDEKCDETGDDLTLRETKWALSLDDLG